MMMTADQQAFAAYLRQTQRTIEAVPTGYWDEIPSNGYGINSERRTRRHLQSRPYDYPELLEAWAGADPEKRQAAELIRQDIEVTHRRLVQHPWSPSLLQGEVDFSDLRLGEFVLRLPSIAEYRELLSRQGVRVSDVTPRTIRDINYALVETALCARYHLSARAGCNFIGNALNGVIHEDLAGFAYIVPHNTHDEYKHRGYVEYVLRMLTTPA